MHVKGFFLSSAFIPINEQEIKFMTKI